MLLGILLCVAGIYASLNMSGAAGQKAEVFVDNKKVAEFNLNGNSRFTKVTTRLGDVTLEYGKGSIRVQQAPCPQKICIRRGSISRMRQKIVCVPCRLLVIIPDSGEKDPNEDQGLDGITE